MWRIYTGYKGKNRYWFGFGIIKENILLRVVAKIYLNSL